MKKILPFIITLVLIMALVPVLSISKKEGQTDTQSSSLNTTSDSDDKSRQEDSEQTLMRYKVLDHKTGEVIEMSPFDYITGVVAAEMPISFNKEALSAQAVAAHTYALRQIDSELRSPNPELMGAFLTTDFTKNQAYISDEELKVIWGKSYEINKKKLNDAVRPVIDMIMTVDDKPIVAAFHSLSNGITESAQNVWGQDISYLTPVKSEGDNLSPKFNVKTVLTSAEVENALKKVYPDIVLNPDKTDWFQILEHTPSNTVSKVRVGSTECTGKELREILGLKSASFNITYANDTFTFDTQGYGHGVGMSQYGADFLARQGKSYSEILKHYYSGIEITSIKDFSNSEVSLTDNNSNTD